MRTNNEWRVISTADQDGSNHIISILRPNELTPDDAFVMWWGDTREEAILALQEGACK